MPTKEQLELLKQCRFYRGGGLDEINRSHLTFPRQNPNDPFYECLLGEFSYVSLNGQIIEELNDYAPLISDIHPEIPLALRAHIFTAIYNYRHYNRCYLQDLSKPLKVFKEEVMPYYTSKMKLSEVDLILGMRDFFCNIDEIEEEPEPTQRLSKEDLLKQCRYYKGGKELDNAYKRRPQPDDYFLECCLGEWLFVDEGGQINKEQQYLIPLVTDIHPEIPLALRLQLYHATEHFRHFLLKTPERILEIFKEDVMPYYLSHGDPVVK